MGWTVADKPVCLLFLLLSTRPLYTRQEMAELIRPAVDGNTTTDVEQTIISRSPTNESQDPQANRSATDESKDPWANTTENLMAGDARVERWTQSLTRLEGSLGSLIESFLAVQRSVFNLEQLQELLVLLLEDILRQVSLM